ncbi:MAG: GNAT family N-acetyltransferase [Spirochaetales bacterium]|nr:GNAT family N-acetyltransferase [Spirochaetales bacterium]
MIETENLVIRKHIEADREDLHSYLSLPEIYRFEPGGPVTLREAGELVKERMEGDDFFPVILKSEGKQIGHLYFHRKDPAEFRIWELGFIFNPAYQNRGYCTEASKAMIGHGFASLNAHKIVAYCNPLNAASWKVLEKIGMKREGLLRKNAFFRKDEEGNPLWHDCSVYGILREDY